MTNVDDQDNGLSILPPPASIDLGMCASPPRNQPSDDRNHGCGPPLTAGVVEFILYEAVLVLYWSLSMAIFHRRAAPLFV